MANRIKESNITPGAVTSDKIAPGTVSASNISPGTITNTLIAPGTIANDRLVNTGITINGTTIALGASGSIVAGTDWQSVITADGSTATTAVAGKGYFIDTTSAAHTINLPASPTQGDEVHIVDYAGTFGTNNVTVGRNSSNIDSAAADATLATNRLSSRFVYIDSTQGWRSIIDDASTNYGPLYVTATGGTVTTSGDYKIHTFTGDGCFVVSCAGNPNGSTTVDYLVVAGGGGSSLTGGDASGGGGGGGFRYSNSTFPVACAPGAPLANPTGLSVSATTYPVTVGAGGTGGTSPGGPFGTSGSNSIFSTITSAGGGYGAAPLSPTSQAGQPGGSGGGGGGGGGTNNAGGTGNTPPTSPSQGNNGGNSAQTTPDHAAGGGGGAMAAGFAGRTTPSPANSGSGGAGAGLPNAFGTSGENCGSYYYFSGGGGGGQSVPIPLGGGAGGLGGGRPAGAPPGNVGLANTGGGGGGGRYSPCGAGGAGGKGIVVIRYKYQ